jgi:hypothetical protein
MTSFSVKLAAPPAIAPPSYYLEGLQGGKKNTTIVWLFRVIFISQLYKNPFVSPRETLHVRIAFTTQRVPKGLTRSVSVGNILNSESVVLSW